MNIPQLLHNCTEQQLIAHWPVLTLGQHKKLWYFYSGKGVTLRKKVQNTSIVGFLGCSHKDDNEDSTNMLILQARQTDCRQPKEGPLYQIKMAKRHIQQILPPSTKTDEQILIANNWQIHPYHQLSLYKIINPQVNRLYSLQWLQNIITCKAPINNYHREKLSQYAELVCKKAEQKILNNLLYIKQFELVFTYDEKNGRLRIVFAHNFVLGCRQPVVEEREREFVKIREMYRSDLKIGRDEHECVQIFIEENKDKNIKKPALIKQATKQNYPTEQNKILQVTKIDEPSLFSQQDQQKRIQYLKFLQKLHSDTALATNIKISLKKQLQSKCTAQQYQCSCCYSYVVLSQTEHKKMISSNRIPQIQIVRQVKMKTHMSNVGDYQLVPVCSLCYDKFKEIVNGRDNSRRPIKSKQQNRQISVFSKQQKQAEFSMKNRVNSMKQRCLIKQLDLVKQEEKTKYATASTTKDTKIIPYLKPNFIKYDEQNTTNTNTKTIRQYYLSSKVNQKPRKLSLCLNSIDKTNPTTIAQIPRSQKTLIPQQPKHRSTHMTKNTRQQKCPSIDFQTDDQLTNAVAEYQQSAVSNKNKQKIRNLRNVDRWKKRVF